MNISIKTVPVTEMDNAIRDLMGETTFPIKQTLTALKRYTTSYLNPNIHAYVEFPYVDKVYRDSYYTYFSTKRRNYQRECIRIALFRKPITEDHFFDKKYHKEHQEEGNFLGFIIVRPSKPKVIGRTVLSPSALKQNHFSTCLVNYKAMINGVDLKTWGFPHQSQDGETMTCAETSIWCTLEYFGNKYPEYKPILPSDIINILRRVSYERQIPSKGLEINQISYTLKKLGLGTKIYAEPQYKKDFNLIINTYVESGIPILARLKFQSGPGHAYLIIGHEKISDKEIDNAISLELPIITPAGEISIIDSSCINKKYVTIDDNFPPYQLIYLNDPCYYYYKDKHGNSKYNINIEEEKKLNEKFSTAQISSIVVPLHKKIYLDAFVAKELILTILSSNIKSVNDDESIGYNHSEKEIILRFFLTSSHSFKRKIAAEETLDTLNKDVRKKIILTTMSRFVWVAELSSKKNLKGKNKKAFGMIVLDATEASKSHLDALMFIIYPDRWHFKSNDGKITVGKDIRISPFNIYNSNLKTT
ncbi:MAG: hypothetical protein HY841_11675 [Bacteroidetes bacterium]|nr:hypothetical protein [Bacteroidota bacterium]